MAAGVAAGSTRSDFKLLLSVDEARAALGESALAQVLDALAAVRGGGAAPSNSSSAPPLVCVTFALRREARSAWIGWHYDDAGATAQVPLGDSGDVVGGQLMLALPSGELLVPPRIAGGLVAHHGDVPHGVTRLERGTRYGLFALLLRRCEM